MLNLLNLLGPQEAFLLALIIMLFIDFDKIFGKNPTS
jgi:hypothetical protein